MAKRLKTNEKDKLELWIGHHNRKLEMVRTVANLISLILTVCIFLKMFYNIGQ
jgi:hypothetical protein